jgi:hypothetical protein
VIELGGLILLALIGCCIIIGICVLLVISYYSCRYLCQMCNKTDGLLANENTL